jgi:hypothetical protein
MPSGGPLAGCSPGIFMISRVYHGPARLANGSLPG